MSRLECPTHHHAIPRSGARIFPDEGNAILRRCLYTHPRQIHRFQAVENYKINRSRWGRRAKNTIIHDKYSHRRKCQKNVFRHRSSHGPCPHSPIKQPSRGTSAEQRNYFPVMKTNTARDSPAPPEPIAQRSEITPRTGRG